MHPDPKHLKNFARKAQCIRGKRIMNSRFLNRSHLPGFERLNARGLVCHLILAIGHHMVRLACRSVTIMARLTTCWRDRTRTDVDSTVGHRTKLSNRLTQMLLRASTVNSANLLPPISFRRS